MGRIHAALLEMNINHGNGKTTDTDKLSDVDAMLLEKAEELRTLCQKFNRQLFLSVECTKDNGIFWNLIGTSVDDKLQNFYESLDTQMKDISNNVFRLAYLNSKGEYVVPR